MSFPRAPLGYELRDQNETRRYMLWVIQVIEARIRALEDAA